VTEGRRGFEEAGVIGVEAHDPLSAMDFPEAFRHRSRMSPCPDRRTT